MRIKISELDFLVIWDALHTEGTVEAVALALKLSHAQAVPVRKRHTRAALMRKKRGEKNV